jgi:halocyanin-like protein
MNRRDFLRTAGGSAAAVGAVTAASGTAAAQEIDYGGWFDDVGNYDGTTVDATGQGEVSVAVGAEGNGGAFAFDPPAVQVDPGTTVVFEWTGEGGQHNVIAEDGGEFESDLVAEAGFTFEHTFEEEGITTYYCEPHRSLGMKGAVAVGEVATGGGEGGGEKELEELGVPIQAHWVGSATILGIIMTLVYSFFVLKYGESPNTGNTGGGR